MKRLNVPYWRITVKCSLDKVRKGLFVLTIALGALSCSKSGGSKNKGGASQLSPPISPVSFSSASSVESSEQFSSSESFSSVFVTSSSELFSSEGSSSSASSFSSVDISSSGETSSSVESSSSSSDPESSTNQKLIHAINAGGVDYTSINGVLFKADSFFYGGSASSVEDVTVNSTDDVILYRAFREGEFIYEFPVDVGTYQVVLHFVETDWVAHSMRVFDVEVENETQLENVDLFGYVGANNALQVPLRETEVLDGYLTIDFNASIGEARVAAVEVFQLDTTGFSNSSSGSSSLGECAERAEEAFICLDFEGLSTGEVPAGFEQIGDVSVVEGEQSYSGRRSLKIGGDDSISSGFLRKRDIPGKHWGRLYLKVNADEVSDGHLQATFIKLKTSHFSAGAVDTVVKDNGLYQYLFTTQSEGRFAEEKSHAHSDFMWFFDEDWTCIEWHLDHASDLYEIYRNGNMVISVSPHNIDSQIKNLQDNYDLPPMYQWIGIGLDLSSNDHISAFEGWIDDVVVAPNRIVCDSPFLRNSH